MHSYGCYGLVIHSSIPLPELIPSEGEVDVVIREGAVPTPPDEEFEEDRYFRAMDDEAFLAWRGVASIKILQGREVVFQRLGGLEESWLRHIILGPGLGVLLHQRGLLVFHGSAVAVGGTAFAILGWKGQGKSTTAAGLRLRGYDLLADDIVAIDMGNPEAPSVLPGIPQSKLWPDAVEALGIDYSTLSPLHPLLEKRAQLLLDTSNLSPHPLRGLYILDLGEEHQIETLPLMDAFSEVVQNSYAARFIGKAGIPPWHFHQCVALTRVVPVNRFRRKSSLGLLPEVLDLLEEHFKSIVSVPIHA